MIAAFLHSICEHEGNTDNYSTLRLPPVTACVAHTPGRAAADLLQERLLSVALQADESTSTCGLAGQIAGMGKRERDDEDEALDAVQELAASVDRALPHLKLRVSEGP